MPQFLSEDWLTEAKRINEESEAPAPATSARINLVVTDAPFSDDDVTAHLDTSEGLVLGGGHIDSPDVTMTMNYDTAKKVLIDGDSNAGAQAFMTGQMKVEGDITKVVTLQAQMTNPGVAEIQQKIAAITDLGKP